jgi:hypothetical protein
MIKIVGTKGNSILGIIIRWLTGENIDHVAIMLNDKIVITSSLLGLHIQGHRSFLKRRTIVDSYEVPVAQSDIDDVLTDAIENYDGKMYDYYAMVAKGFSLLIKKLTGIIIKYKKPPQNPEWYWCIEVISLLFRFKSIEEKFKDVKLYDITPEQVILLLRSKNV